MRTIESRNNQTYKALKELVKNKEKRNKVLIEGGDLVEEAYATGKLKIAIYYDAEKIKINSTTIETLLMPRELYRELCSYQSLPDVIGVSSFELAEEIDGNFIYLDGVQDPGNVGTIVRTALAFGYSGVMLSTKSASPYNSKVVQSTKGALFGLPIMVKNLNEWSERYKYHIYGTSLKGQPISEDFIPETPFILVMGSEGLGISPEIEAMSERNFLIPIKSVDSLNVSVAAGIFMYKFRRI